jgi:hypothetical protein
VCLVETSRKVGLRKQFYTFSVQNGVRCGDALLPLLFKLPVARPEKSGIDGN